MRQFLQRWIAKLGLENMPRLRKTLVAIIGTTIVLLGLVLIVLPGPAIVVIPLGLAVLATEFTWARRVLKRGKFFVDRVRGAAPSEKSAEPQQ